MSNRFADSLRAGSGWNCRSILILLASCQQTCMTYHCYMYSEKLLMMNRGTVWNMLFHFKNKFEKLVHLLLRWRYSPGWALASFAMRLQASRSLALSRHSFIPIFLRSVDTSSSHLIFGLPLRLVAYSFPCNIFFGIAVSYILSIWPSHRILWHLTLRWLMSYIYGAPILDVSRSHTTTQHSR